MQIKGFTSITLAGYKAILAVICGVILALITSPIHSLLGSPIGDYVLLAIYFADYLVVVQVIPRRLKVHQWLRKGITVFYAVELIVWMALYEIITYG